MSDHDFDPDLPPLWGDLETLCTPISPSVETGAGSVPAQAHHDAVAALREVTAAFELLSRILEQAPRLDGKFDEIDRIAFLDLERAKVAVARFRRERDCGQALDLTEFACSWLQAMEA